MLQIKELNLGYISVGDDFFSLHFIEHAEVLCLEECEISGQGCAVLAERIKKRIKPVKYLKFFGRIFINFYLLLTKNYSRRCFCKIYFG